jgi:hypothetical protein
LTLTVNRWVSTAGSVVRPCRLERYCLVGLQSGKVMPADCDTGCCQTCGVRRAGARAVAITWAQRRHGRSRLITLTRAPADWQSRRGQVRDLRRRIVESGRRCEWIWTTEAGSKTGMVHVHAIQHGDYIPQAELQTLWGGRIVDVRAVHDASKYISKSAGLVAGYIGKNVSRETSGLAGHLELNGGRLHHWSRQFFEGLSIRAAVAASRGDKSDEMWIGVFRGDADDETCRRRAWSSVNCRPPQ